MFKKVSLVTLIFVLILGLVITGCGQQQTSDTSQNQSGPEPASTGEEANIEADEYPTRTIEYYIGFGAGGGTDVFGRTINIPVRQLLGAQIVEINLTGGASINAMTHVLQQPADGYTLFGVTSDIFPGIAMGRTEYSHRDLTPIICAHVDPGCVETRKDAPFKTWDEFVKYAKDHPGEISWGGTGSASFDEVVIAHTFLEAGIEVKYIPFESASEMHAALLGGHIDVMYEEPGVIIDMITNGDIIPLLSLTGERLSILPDVVCSGELGYELPPMIRRGVAVKKGTPDEIVKKLEQAYTEALESSVYQEYASSRMLDLYPGYLNSEDYAQNMEQEYQIYERILKELGHI